MKDYRESLSEMTWVLLRRWLGEPRQVSEVRRQALDFREQVKLLGEQVAGLEARLAEQQGTLEQAHRELERTRDERLGWQAKEASVRKELQDCQERNKELLEKVVELTQLKRKAEQSLLEQRMKTESTPLERNRFEAELAEARARVRDAEQRAKKAEQEAARARQLQQQVARVKDLEQLLTWEARRADAHQAALAAALGRVRELENKLQQTAAQVEKLRRPPRRPYRKPRIRLSRQAVLQA